MSDAAADAPDPVPPAQEEAPVEIHKPKPIHSWRDFGKELGTIVLGIIIAISLEHFVESWSWDNEVTAARQAIHAEMAANNDNSYAYRIALSPCLQKELSEANAVLAALEAGRKTGGLSHFSPAPASFVRDSEWQSERASQVLTHFPRAELALMSRYYGQLEDIKSTAIDEANAFQDLAPLQNPPSNIGTTDLIQIRKALRSARSLEALVVSFAKRQLRISAQLGLPEPKVDPVRVKNFCTMSQEDFIRYRSSQDLR
jgi:hypothetical protein